MLNKLTQAQKDLMPIIRDKWIKWGIEPTGRSHAVIQENMKFLYEQANLAPVPVIVCDTHKDFVSELKQVAGDSVWASVKDSVWASVWASVKDSVWASVKDSVRDSVWASVKDSVWASVKDSVWASVKDSVRGGSYYWADDISFGDYFEQIGVLKDKDLLDKFHKNIDALQDYAFAMFTDKVCIVLIKPEVSLDEQGRLHNDSNMAMRWGNDGFYYLAGVKFDEELWNKVVSGQMSFKEILDIENTEQRLQAMRFNPNALLKENPTLVDKSERGNELWVIENSEVNKLYDEPKVWLLGFIDPSKKAPNNKMYEEASPELCATTNDADLVQAFHLGLTPEEYQQLKLET